MSRPRSTAAAEATLRTLGLDGPAPRPRRPPAAQVTIERAAPPPGAPGGASEDNATATGVIDGVRLEVGLGEGGAAWVRDLRVTLVDADTLEGGRRAARAIVDAHPRVTAIVCVNDVMAVGALRELRERGLRVPEDVSVTGFDNVNLAQFCHPALTTVHIPRDQIGQTICSCLLPGENAPLEHEFVISRLRHDYIFAPTPRASYWVYCRLSSIPSQIHQPYG